MQWGAAGRWEGWLYQIGAVVSALAEKKMPVNPYRPPPRPRVMSEAEKDHETKRFMLMLDTYMDQTFGG